MERPEATKLRIEADEPALASELSSELGRLIRHAEGHSEVEEIAARIADEWTV